MCSSPNDAGVERSYLSYLLRLWRVDLNGTSQLSDGARSRPALPIWRASLEDARTGERTGFAGLEELLDFLMEQIGTTPGEASGRHKTIDDTEPGGLA